MGRLWEKGEAADDLMLRFTVGEDFLLDERLVPYDVRASAAHARMLHECGHLDEEEHDAIVRALAEVETRHAAGEWSIAPEEEDVHTALENRLVERLGATGERLHLGRSRNDQVLAALRLYMLDAVDELVRGGRGVCEALALLAGEQGAIRLPGYTHMQRAMPSSVALWAGAFRAEIEDDLEGLVQARRRISKNPLGSAAGYGVPVVEIDRARTTELLGFETTQEPVTAVQLSRGKAEAGLLFEITLLMQDLGRLAADVCLFATAEFGFVQLPARFTTGSSIMPQKRNPDVFELMRGRAAQSLSWLSACLQITSKLGSGYHRDLQLLKPPLFASIDAAGDTLAVAAHVLPHLRFVPERTEAAMDASLFATERALRLVQEEGLPFREAYRRVAREEEAKRET